MYTPSNQNTLKLLSSIIYPIIYYRSLQRKLNEGGEEKKRKKVKKNSKKMEKRGRAISELSPCSRVCSNSAKSMLR